MIIFGAADTDNSDLPFVANIRVANNKGCQLSVANREIPAVKGTFKYAYP